MTIATPQLRDLCLRPGTIRVSLAGSLEGLVYPQTCPNCGAPATAPILIAKVFSYNYNDDDGGGWQHRIARAAPLFCASCLTRHRLDERPVTILDQLKSLVLTELALPAIGTLAFAFFLVVNMGAKIARNPAGEMILAGLIALLLLIGVLCFRAAWTTNLHRRIPAQTEISLAFDFGDDQSTAFQTVLRTYAFRNASYATAFSALNAYRSNLLLGPVQRRRETARTLVTAVIVLAIVAAGWWYNHH